MLIEKINSASFANGILRLQVATTNGRGEWVETDTLEIPGPLVSAILSQITQAANDISEQLVQQNEEVTSTSTNGEKDIEKSKKSKKDKEKN